MKQQRKPCFVGVAAAAMVVLATAQVSCGGGVGELIAVAAFLGSGGGQFQLEPRPVPATYGIFDDAMTLSLTSDAAGTVAPDLYASGYNINVIGVNGVRLQACSNRSGRVEGDRVTIGNCFSGRYENVNRIVSDDGTRALYHEFDPNLTTGLWVDVNDAGRAFKFVGSSVACEYAGSTKRAASVVRRSASITQAQVGQPFTLVTSGITSLAVVGGSTWTGEFIGISGLRLRSGSTTLELQRRNLQPPAACP